jgi:hypothetical protein
MKAIRKSISYGLLSESIPIRQKEREVLPFVEEVRRIALNKKLQGVCHEHEFDVLSAVLIELFKDENFLSKRWPQILALMARQREAQPR